ncbi:unnamed protein product [Hymenolepis diminuta]|uniref:Uncharacterized protein n=1 Tax=Hymenolepis diminuta TaxID=6216 RepID=A0A564XVZ0_HYMDI|nr:unnamed protein product [Hymenolepis diminuta]
MNCFCLPTHTHWSYTAPTLPSYRLCSLSLSPILLNPHCDLVNTFWPNQLLVFWSEIVFVVTLTPRMSSLKIFTSCQLRVNLIPFLL